MGQSERGRERKSGGENRGKEGEREEESSFRTQPSRTPGAALAPDIFWPIARDGEAEDGESGGEWSNVAIRHSRWCSGIK